MDVGVGIVIEQINALAKGFEGKTLVLFAAFGIDGLSSRTANAIVLNFDLKLLRGGSF